MEVAKHCIFPLSNGDELETQSKMLKIILSKLDFIYHKINIQVEISMRQLIQEIYVLL